jgi:hypothetical protein
VALGRSLLSASSQRISTVMLNCDGDAEPLHGEPRILSGRHWAESRPPRAEEHLRLLRDGDQRQDHLSHAPTRLLTALTLRRVDLSAPRNPLRFTVAPGGSRLWDDLRDLGRSMTGTPPSKRRIGPTGFGAMKRRCFKLESRPLSRYLFPPWGK